MKYLIGAIAWIVNFIFSKKSRLLALLPVKISITIIFILVGSLYLGSILAFVYFLITLFNTLYSFIEKANQISVSGNAYGISLSNIWNAFLIFLNASGLSPAILTSLSLLISLLTGYFTFALTKMITEKIMIFLNGVTDIVRMYDA